MKMTDTPKKPKTKLRDKLKKAFVAIAGAAAQILMAGKGGED
jgi:hypothetical protein